MSEPGPADRRGRAAKRRTPAWRRALVTVGLALSGTAGILVIMGRLGWLEHALVYHPLDRGFTTPAGVEDVRFATTDGLTLHGWFIPAEGVDGPAPTVLHAHGNAGSVADHAPFSAWLADEGYNVFLFDYRDYGRSDDAPRLRHREDFIADAHAALDALLERDDVDPDRIALLGVSLGAVLGGGMAAERDQIRAAVLVAGFATWKGIAGDVLPVIGPLAMPGGRDLEDAVARFGDRPVLVVHGDADPVVGPRHAERIARAARDAGVPVETHIEPGGDHNTLLVAFPETREAILDFLVRTLKKDRSLERHRTPETDRTPGGKPADRE